MTGCCERGGYDAVFGAKRARANAKRYRRKGLDATARRMVDYLRGRGLAGRTLLEVGGGVGAIQIELLRAGADRAVNAELSAGYEDVARELLEEAGLAGRVERRLLDFAREAHALEPADVVVMHRVVCCYPDMDALVAAAAQRARRSLAMSFPRDAWYLRLGIRAENLWQRLRRRSFRAYLHPPRAILAAAEAHGLQPAFGYRDWVWQSVVLERVATESAP
jgi:magnesium-protoporphyrin O-methyltransferase